MKLRLLCLVLSIAQSQKCTFDECVACAIVEANGNYYPSFKRMCGMVSPCCQTRFELPLKQTIGDFGGLAEKKLTETMYQLLEEKTLNVESSIKSMKSSQMTLIKMDRNDNTDMIFNQPAQKVPIGKKHPTYVHAVLPTKEIDEEYLAKNKLFGEKIIMTP